MRYVRLLAAAVACLVGLYFTMLGAFALRSGLSWREMDLDRDGTTEWWEFFEAADVSTRPYRRDGHACMEYFWLKDGRTVKVVCPAG